MADLLDLTAAQAASLVRAGDLDPADLWTVYRDRAAADTLNAYTWVAGEAPEFDRYYIRNRTLRVSATASRRAAGPDQATAAHGRSAAWMHPTYTLLG